MPVPLQYGQVVFDKKLPNMVRCSEVMVPLPWHSLHVLGSKPPFPWHSLHSSSTSISKKSSENITKRFINLYKETLSNNLGQKFENDFDINYSAFLLILYKVGFTNRNYSTLMENTEMEMDKQSLHSKENSDFSISNSSLSMSQISNNKKNFN